MAFQEQIYSTLAPGIEGEYADDSARRDTAYMLVSNVSQEAAAAEGTLTFTANPANGDTVTIGATVYTFATTATGTNDIEIGDDLAATLNTFVETVNAKGDVIADVENSVVTLTAPYTGVQGNSIALASSDDNVTVSAMAGGANEVSNMPHFGYAFTHNGVNGQVQVGGTGLFAGVLVNPKMYVNYQNLKSNMFLPSGTQGSVCDFGHVFIKSNTSYEIGSIAAYDNATGAISAYASADDVPATSTVIERAKFIKYAGSANICGILELGN